MDSLTNNNKVPFNIASFPLFNLSLLSENTLDFSLPDLISIDYISGVVHKKLQGDIDLNDAFDIFAPKATRGSKPALKQQTQFGPTKIIRKRAKSSISMQKRLPCLTKNVRFKNALRATNQKLTLKKNQTTKMSQGLESVPTLLDVPVENFKPFPSLASILGDDDTLSSDEDEPPLEMFKNYSSRVSESQSNKMLNINFNENKNEQDDLISQTSADLCGPFINWGNQSIFEKLICGANISQNTDKLSKRAECDSYGLEGAFYQYNCQDDVILNSEKLGNFDLALDADTASDSFVSQCEAKLGEDRNLNLHNTSNSFHATVHL